MITVQRLTKTIGSRSVLRDVSFTASAGRITGFVGPNGAGKTTALRIALGLACADAGTVRFDGVAYRDLPRPLRQVGSLLDAGRLIPDLRAREVLDYCARTQGLDPPGPGLLADVGLAGAAERRVAHLSLGMRQRLGIAVALLGSPRHLILDEPLNGLDPTGIGWLRELLRELRDRGCAILLSSHIVSELALIADDVVVIDGGRVVLAGPMEKLADHERRRVLARTDCPGELAAAARARQAEAEHMPGGPVNVTGLAPREVFVLAAEHGIVLDELTEVRRSLDDVYREAVGGAAALPVASESQEAR